MTGHSNTSIGRDIYATLATGPITQARAVLLVQDLLSQGQPFAGDTKLAVDILANLEDHRVVHAIDLTTLRKTLHSTDASGLATFDALASRDAHSLPFVDPRDYRCLSRLLFVALPCSIDLIALAQDTCFSLQRCAFQEAYHGLQCLVSRKDTSAFSLISSFAESATRHLSHIRQIYPSVILQWEHVFLKRISRRQRMHSR